MPFKDIEKRREWTRVRYNKHIEEERLRNRLKYHKFKENYKVKSEEYRKNNLDKFALKAIIQRKKHIKEHKARSLSLNILKDFFCNLCGERNNTLEKHHPNYDYPLKIITLCRRCHNKIHMKGGL